MRRTAPDVATGTGALLPHLFTLIPIAKIPIDTGIGFRDGYFLLRGFGISPDFPLGSMAPYVARTFLTDMPAQRRYQRDRTDCRDKNTKKSHWSLAARHWSLALRASLVIGH